MRGFPMLAHGGIPVLVKLLDIVHRMPCELAHALRRCSRADAQVILHGGDEGSWERPSPTQGHRGVV